MIDRAQRGYSLTLLLTCSFEAFTTVLESPRFFSFRKRGDA